MSTTIKGSDSLDDLLQKIRLATQTSQNAIEAETNICPHCGSNRHSNPYANLKNFSGIDPNGIEGIFYFTKFLIVKQIN